MRDMGHGHPGNQSSDGRTSVTTSGKYLQGEVLIKLLQLLQLFTEREKTELSWKHSSNAPLDEVGTTLKGNDKKDDQIWIKIGILKSF